VSCCDGVKYVGRLGVYGVSWVKLSGPPGGDLRRA